MFDTKYFVVYTQEKRQIEQILEEKSETIHAPRSGFLLFFAEVRIQGISY
jgi:hypothetical protein